MKQTFRDAFGLGTVRKIAALVFVATLLLTLASCATAPKQAINKPTSQDIDYALTDAMNCVKSAIPKFDDRVSSAETIGHAAIESCNSEVNTYTETALRGTSLDTSEYPEMSEKIRGIFSDVSVRLVLKSRVQAASP